MKLNNKKNADSLVMQAFDDAAFFAMDVCRLNTEYALPAELSQTSANITKELMSSCSGLVLNFSGVGLYPTEEFNQKGTVFGKIHAEGGLVDAGVVPMTALPVWDLGDLHDMFSETDPDELADAIESERVMEPETGYRYVGKFLIAQGTPDDFLAGACIVGDVRYMAYVDLSSIVINGIEKRDPIKATEAKSPLEIDETLYQLSRSHRKMLSSSKYLRSPLEIQRQLTDSFVANANNSMRLSGNEFMYWGDEVLLPLVDKDSGHASSVSRSLEDLGESSIHGKIIRITSLADIYLSNGDKKINKRKIDPNKALCLCGIARIGEKEEIVYIPIAENIEDNVVISVPYSVF